MTQVEKGVEMANLEEIQEEVFEKLQLLDVAQLGQCCVQLGVTIPPAKKGKKTAIKALVLKHLTSDAMEEDDSAEDIFSTLNNALDGMIKETEEKEGKKDAAPKPAEEGDKDEKKSDVKKEVAGSSTAAKSGIEQVSENVASASGKVISTTRVEVSRFGEFKVSPNTFGGEKHVDYTSLCYQIEDAKELSYTSREIVSGMIKSMKQPLKRYCEGKRNWSLEKLMTHIRSYAKVANSEEVMDEMKVQAQKTDQTEEDFLLEMCVFRDNVVAMTKQEENPLDEARIEKNFLRALLAGFRKDTIRLMLTPVLKQSGLDDGQLLKEVNEAVQAEAESRKKNKGGGKSVASNSLDAVQSGAETPTAVESRVLKELEKLTGKMTELECKVNSISSGNGSSGSGNGDNTGGGQRPRFIKCQPCEKEGRYCKHCSLCGKMGHKRANCQEAAGNE